MIVIVCGQMYLSCIHVQVFNKLLTLAAAASVSQDHTLWHNLLASTEGVRVHLTMWSCVRACIIPATHTVCFKQLKYLHMVGRDVSPAVI